MSACLPVRVRTPSSRPRHATTRPSATETARSPSNESPMSMPNKAAPILAALDMDGYSVEYQLGERNLSYAEITQAIGTALNKPDLRYVQLPREQATQAMKMAGISENVAGLLADLSDGINNGKVLERYERVPENTTKTSIEEFAKGFAKMFKQ